jgi:aryl-alcohol dehydrogenase-like predicted oxidoreductase
VKAGKVRYVGLSNETPYGVSEFVRLAEQHGLPRVATVQNPYALVNRALDNGLDETHVPPGRVAAGLFAAGVRLLTGKYDRAARRHRNPKAGMAALTSRCASSAGAAPTRCRGPRYNALAREHGLTPTQLALAFCYTKWQRGEHHHRRDQPWQQLDEEPGRSGHHAVAGILAEIDAIRWKHARPGGT